jgi:prepilin-type N-terminal cleavage/methylation domain-containing protein
MHKRREGFTLIELLIVIVIIGILAAIALPKFGATREKAYVKAMESDLRNLAAQQEIYYSESTAYEYFADDLAWDDAAPNDLNLTISTGVSLSTEAQVDPSSWSATATHAATDTECAIFTGATAPGGSVAESPGVIKCVKPGTTAPGE